MGKFIEGNEERRLSLELYRKDELFGVYISDNEGGSGITVEEPSPEEAAKEAAKYIADYFVNNDEDDDEEEEENVVYFDDNGTQINVGDVVAFKNQQESCTYDVVCFEDDFVVIDDGESKLDVFPYELVVIQSALQEEDDEYFEDIKEHLDEWAEGKDIEEVEVYLRTKGAECCDEDIDDGVGNGEYLMYRAYELGEHTIKVYYSSTTHEVTCVQYREN